MRRSANHVWRLWLCNTCRTCKTTPNYGELHELHELHKGKRTIFILSLGSKAGWSWGCVTTLDRYGRTIFVADTHRGNGKRFVVHADEKLTAFVELESAIRPCAELACQVGEIFGK